MSSNLWRLVVLFGVFLLSFEAAFQPLGRPQQEIQSTFRVAFSAPVVPVGTDEGKFIEEIKTALKAGGVGEDEIDKIRVINDRELEISTLALDQQQAQRDKENILAALQRKYPDKGVTIGLPPGVGQARQPLWQLGNALAIYRPMPRINLGLDLQGGAHVVLQCLPYARMTFTVPETKPFVMPATEEERKSVAPGWKTTETAETLSKRVLRALTDLGLKPDKVRVELVSPTLLTVETQPADQRELTKQSKTIVEVLKQTYPQLSYEEIKAEAPEAVFLEAGIAEKVKNIIDRRLYAMSEIREPLIQVQGNDRIIVQLPGVRDPERVLRILKSTAMLKFVLVPARYELANPGAEDYEEWRDRTTGQTVSWARVMAESEVKFTGRDLQSNAEVGPGQAGDWVVHFELQPKKKREFYNFTRANIGRIMAIVLDDQCQMAPVIKDAIPGEGIIEGNFTTQEARDLKLLLNAGALPVPLEIAENRTVSPTLGRDTVAASLRAGLIGCAAVVLFMLLYYRLPGLVADIALCLYVIILLAVLVIANVTLTLPGIAGLIVSIGMAVDANVLIFERLKEELWAGKGMRAAIEAGFHRAWTAILDANVTTLIACAVLYFLGTSSIKTFAVTLFLGVCVSMFSAIVVSRWLLDIMGSTRLGQRLELYTPGARQLAAAQSSSRAGT
ncbi:MAG: protein translocase subunit SecD [Armatimonadetes bacterium]|nr:protein translocase subunit SecD [Armatimonadota bacterium]